MFRILLVLLLLNSGLVWAGDADISVNVRLFQARIITGDLAKMEVTIRNDGPETTSGVGLNLNIMQGQFTDINVSAAGDCDISVASGQVQCQNVGEFSPGASKVILMRVRMREVVETEPENLVIQAGVAAPENDPNPSNNQETVVFRVDPLPTVDGYALGMLTGMPENRRQRFERAARILALYCSGQNMHVNLGGACADILQQAELGDFETLTRVLSWMEPRNVVHQARNSTKLVASQLSNLGQRMAQLRSGLTGFSVADLQLSNGTESLPISMLAYQADESTQAESFVSPWGFFVNGTITTGDFSYADDINDGFDFDSDSITAGVDYRFSNRFVLGAAVGYNQLDSNTDTGVDMEAEGLSVNLYGLFTPTDNFYLDTRLSYARPDIKQVRVESFQVIDNLIELRAVGDTEAKQLTAALNAGYNFNKGAWLWSPFIGIEYVESQLDSFTEDGAGGFNVFYAEQDFESTKYHLGFTVSRAISLSRGVLSPQFSFQHNYEDQDNGIMAMRLINMPVNELFNVDTNFTEKNYSEASFGLTWVFGNGKMFYFRYNRLFGLDDFDQDSISFGARFEF